MGFVMPLYEGKQAHSTKSVRVCTYMSVWVLLCVCVCVWLGYRVCLHYTLFRLIWLTLNRYWFPLLCSPRLPHSLSLSLYHTHSLSPYLPAFLLLFSPSLLSSSSGSVPAAGAAPATSLASIVSFHTCFPCEEIISHQSMTERVCIEQIKQGWLDSNLNVG